MKVIGIVAEFNPFHNGHKYLIDQAKSITKADYVVVVMSGSFTQRGEPAWQYKYDRVTSALQCGADLCLEMPINYATATAEAFAYGGVSILNALNCIDYIAFGSESGNINDLSIVVKELLHPTESFTSMMNEALIKGLSYPAARAYALPEYRQILSSPNNVLGIEYLKSICRLNSNITPITIQRIGAGFHDDNAKGKYSSAEAIRNHLGKEDKYQDLIQSVPSNIQSMTAHASKLNICSDDFSQIIKYLLITTDKDRLCKIQDMNSDLADRIVKSRNRFDTLSSFIEILKTKELTYTRLSRAMCHLLLDLQDMTKADNNELLPAPYTRILGFKKSASQLMHELAKSTSIPLINKAADAHTLLDSTALKLFNETIKADRIYNSIYEKKNSIQLPDPIQNSPIILKT